MCRSQTQKFKDDDSEYQSKVTLTNSGRMQMSLIYMGDFSDLDKRMNYEMLNASVTVLWLRFPDT